MNKLLLILACSAAALCAQEKKPAAEPKPPVKRAETAGQGSVRVYKDPITGELRAPTAAERQSQGQSLQTPGPIGGEPPQIIRNPDGSRTAILGPAQMSYSVMKKNSDGTITMDCVTGEKKAAEFLKTAKERSHDQ